MDPKDDVDATLEHVIPINYRFHTNMDPCRYIISVEDMQSTRERVGPTREALFINS